MSLLISKQFAKFTKILTSVKKLLNEKEFEKYKALYHKFMKVSGIHQIELQKRLGERLIEPQKKDMKSPEGIIFIDEELKEED